MYTYGSTYALSTCHGNFTCRPRKRHQATGACTVNGRKNKYANDHSSVTELLWGLHWLPIKARVLYKTVLPAFQILNAGTSPYLTTLHTRKSFCIVTRTSEKLNIIKVPTLKDDTVRNHSQLLVHQFGTNC